MNIKDLQATDWFPSLVVDVARELDRLSERRQDQRPALHEENEHLQAQIDGWSVSLAKRDLDPALRSAIESNWSRSLERQHEIESLLAEHACQDEVLRQIVDPQQVVSRLKRLADVLASNNPTQGNIELSLHVDRIDCFPDGNVQMRTCKLGAVAGAVELLASDDGTPVDHSVTLDGSLIRQAKPRRRARLRSESPAADGEAEKAAVYLATDPDRFAGLGQEWFWTYEFQVPGRKRSWADENAARVFQRRQEFKMSYSELALEFGVTPPTIGAAIRRYLERNAGETDKVKLPHGGKRRPRIDVTSFAMEARRLWEQGSSKEALAKKYGYSPPTIDKALAYAFEQDGLTLPNRQDLLCAIAARARQIFEQLNSLQDVAKAMEISVPTARKYVKHSFVSEGKAMPDLRHRRNGVAIPPTASSHVW